MKIIARVAFLLALLAVVDGVIFLVLTANLRAGVYPTDADSIGIPLMESAVVSAVAAGLLLTCAAASSFSWRRRPAPIGAFRWLAAAALTITHLACAGLFALWGWSWSTPNHYPILVACVLAASAILYLGLVDLGRLRPNSGVQPKPVEALRGASTGSA
jgi:hypothetical protein